MKKRLTRALIGALAMVSAVPRPGAQTPPPPSEEPPPKADEPPPTFGVSMNATTSGESAVSVPVGQTLMTKPAPKHKEAPLPSGDGTGGFGAMGGTVD